MNCILFDECALCTFTVTSGRMCARSLRWWGGRRHAKYFMSDAECSLNDAKCSLDSDQRQDVCSSAEVAGGPQTCRPWREQDVDPPALSMQQTEMEVRRANCSLNHANCSLGEASCSLDHAKCSLTDAKCSLKWRKRTRENLRASVCQKPN
jgi:hypothetical protein